MLVSIPHNKPLSQCIGFGGARNIRVGEYNSLYTVQCLEIGKGGGWSIIGGGGPTGHWQHFGPNAKKNVLSRSGMYVIAGIVIIFKLYQT